MWGNVKRKDRRPIESIVLPDGVLSSILRDAREFMNSEGWYRKAGIPHRMGFLLHGPPGTGKSTSCMLAEYAAADKPRSLDYICPRTPFVTFSTML